MTQDDSTKNPVEAFKNTYFSMLDQASELAKQPLESTKKIMGATFDAQTQAWNSIAQNPAMSQLREMASMSTGFMEQYSKRMSEGFEMAKKSSDVITEIALSWQKVALDAQMNAFNAYKSWFSRFTA